MKIIRRGDIAVALLILILSAGVFIFRFLCLDKGDFAEITVGDTSSVYPLGTDRKIDIKNEGHNLTVVIKNGKAFVEKSDCLGHNCINMGKIDTEGEFIACAPARVFVKIVGEGESDYDEIVG